jgi:hypothetical protein
MKSYLVVALLVLPLFGCGGGGVGASAVDSGNTALVPVNAIDHITFANRVSQGASLDQARAIVVTSIDQQVDQKIAFSNLLDRVVAMMGIRPAHAKSVSTSINGLYFLDAGAALHRVDFLESLHPVSGSRSPISDAALKAAPDHWVPSVRGVFTTPLFVLQSVSNLYKPNKEGAINRDDVSTRCPVLAIERSTGKMACISVEPWCEKFTNCGNTFGNTSIQSNGRGEIVYLQDVHHNLIKLDMSSFPAIVLTQLTDGEKDGFIQSLVVNKDGDAYVNIDTRVEYQNLFRIYKNTGGYESLTHSGIFKFVNCPFSGPDDPKDANHHQDANNFYFADESNRYWKVSKDGKGGFGSPAQLKPGFQLEISSGNNCASLVKDDQYVHSIPDPQWRKSFVTELTSPIIFQGNDTPRKIDFSGQLNRIVGLHSYTGFLVVWGKDAQEHDILVKYNKATGAKFSFYGADAPYLLLSIAVSAFGDVTAVVQNPATEVRHLAALQTTSLNSIALIKPLESEPVQIISPN